MRKVLSEEMLRSLKRMQNGNNSAVMEGRLSQHTGMREISRITNTMDSERREYRTVRHTWATSLTVYTTAMVN